MVVSKIPTATKTPMIQVTRELSLTGNNETSIAICVELFWMIRPVVVPVVVRIATLRRQGIKIQQYSPTSWEATPNVIICGSCSASR